MKKNWECKFGVGDDRGTLRIDVTSDDFETRQQFLDCGALGSSLSVLEQAILQKQTDTFTVEAAQIEIAYERTKRGQLDDLMVVLWRRDGSMVPME